MELLLVVVALDPLDRYVTFFDIIGNRHVITENVVICIYSNTPQ